MLLVKGTHKGHACDSHYLLHVILDCQHKNLFYVYIYTSVTSKGHKGSLPAIIKLPLGCTVFMLYILNLYWLLMYTYVSLNC